MGFVRSPDLGFRAGNDCVGRRPAD